MHTDAGVVGIGEGTVEGRIGTVAAAIKELEPYLVGKDPRQPAHHWQAIYRQAFYRGDIVLTSALSAVDIAIWDIKGKALGVPVYELLGGLVRDKVVCYPHVTGDSTESLIENALQHVEEGWKFVRWGLSMEHAQGNQFEPRAAIRYAAKQWEAMREAVGEEIELCFDMHTRIEPPEAIWLCREVEQYRPFFMEDPIRSESMESVRIVRQHVNVPLAIGEQFAGKWAFRQIIEEELTDYARVDLCIAGGITEAKKIAAAAEMHYIKLATHNPLGPISSAACLHLNLACSNVGVQEQPTRPGTLLTDVVPLQMDWQDGYLLPPTRPGLGVEFDREAAKASPFQMYEVPHLQRGDGSFTNW
jgi:L-alanine-DL-glutamate epimerase-like enolase superfamily enzyme